jgi:hypothetical protein
MQRAAQQLKSSINTQSWREWISIHATSYYYYFAAPVSAALQLSLRV